MITDGVCGHYECDGRDDVRDDHRDAHAYDYGEYGSRVSRVGARRASVGERAGQRRSARVVRVVDVFGLPCCF